MPQAHRQPRILLVVNSSWNVVNFRGGLVRGLIAAGYEVVVATPDDGHADGVRALGARFVPLPMDTHGRSPFRDLVLLSRLFQLMRREAPDAFLGFTIKPNVYGSFAARLARVPAVNNIAGLGSMFSGHRLVVRLVRLLYRSALARSRCVFFQNREDLASFVEHGVVPAAAARLLPGSGVDLTRFKADPVERPADRPFAFLLIGRLLREKGVGEFVAAARIVAARGIAARFALLGFVDAGNPAAVSRAELQAWIDAGSVDYLGTAPDVRPFLQDADCLVLPSYYREGTPRTLLEGAAMAVPLITTDMPGCRDVVDDGVNGYLVPPRDASALAEAMLRIVALAPAERAAMGRASRRKAESDYDERIIIAAYRDVLDRIIGGQGDRAKPADIARQSS